MVTLGAHDVVLVCGYEKLFNVDKMKSFVAFDGAVDTENPDGLNGALKLLAAEAGEVVDVQLGDKSRSVFMDIYAYMTKAHMKKYGTTREQIAAVTAKNSRHGALNPRAQFQTAMTVAEVLAAREIVWPLTLPMCSPIGDGAAARRDRERTQGEGHGPVAARAGAVLGAGLGLRRRRGKPVGGRVRRACSL